MFKIGTLVCLATQSQRHKHTGVIIEIQQFDVETYLIHFTDSDMGWWTGDKLEVLCK